MVESSSRLMWYQLCSCSIKRRICLVTSAQSPEMESHWLSLNHMTTPSQSLWPRGVGCSDWWGLSYLPTSLKGSRFSLHIQDANNGKKRQGCWAARGANLHLTNLIKKMWYLLGIRKWWQGRHGGVKACVHGLQTRKNLDKYRGLLSEGTKGDGSTSVLEQLCCSIAQLCLFLTPWTAAHHAFLSFTISQSLLKLMSIELVVPSNHLILCQPLLLLPSIFPNIRVFSSESLLCVRWPKYRSFSNNLSNEYSELTSFRIDWFNILAVQGTLKSLLQHHSSKASVLQCSAFFMAQLSHPYLTTRNTIALTRWTFVGKVMALLFYTLSRFA